MKKSYLIGGIAGALILGYPLAAFTLGKNVESSFNDIQTQIKQLPTPILKTISRTYDRGVMSAVEDVVYEVDISKLSHKKTERPIPPVQFAVHSDISHGPFPAFSGFGSARVRTTVTLMGEYAKEVGKALGTTELKSFLTANTLFGYGGSGKGDFESPSLKFDSQTLPAEENPHPDEQLVIDWKGIKGEYTFAGEGKHYTLKADAPGGNALTKRMDSGDEVEVQIDKIALNSQSTAISVPNLTGRMPYTGTQTMSIEGISIGPKGTPDVKLSKLAFASDTPLKGDFIDVNAKFGVDRVLLKDKTEIGPIKYEYGLRHLYLPAAAIIGQTFYQKLWQVLQNPDADPADLAKDLSPDFTKALSQIASKAPEYHIDRVSIGTPKSGEALFNLHLRLAEVNLEALKDKPAEIQTALIDNFFIDGELNIPEALVAELSRMDPNKKFSDEDLEQFYALVTHDGYVARDKGVLNAKLKLEKGKLTVNGKDVPLGPLLMGAMMAGK